MVAIPVALIIPLRAARSWQPRTFALGPSAVLPGQADRLHDFFWKPDGLLLMRRDASVAPVRALANWNGQRVPLRVWPSKGATTLDKSGHNMARCAPDKSGCQVELWDVRRATRRKAPSLALQGARRGDRIFVQAQPLFTLSPDGKRVAWNVSYPGGVRLADARTGHPVANFARVATEKIKYSPILALAWSPDGRELALIGPSDVWIVDATDGRLRRSWSKPKSAVTRAVWSPDGRSLALCYSHVNWPYPARLGATTPVTLPFLWVHDARNGQLLQQREQNVGPMDPQGATNLAWSPDGKRLAWGTFDGHAHILNMTSSAIERSFAIVAPQWFALPANARAPGGATRVARPANMPYQLLVAYAPDGATLAVASQSQITLYRIK